MRGVKFKVIGTPPRPTNPSNPTSADFEWPPSPADPSVLAFPELPEESSVPTASNATGLELQRSAARPALLRVRWSTALVVAIAVAETVYLGIHAVAATGRPIANQPAVLPSWPVMSPLAASLPRFAVPDPGLTGRTPSQATDPVDTKKPAVERPGSRAAVPRSIPARRAENAKAPAEPLPADLPGWASLDLPIQVQVFEHGRFVGTNDSGRVTLAAGPHELELVNESLQYRSTQTVNITPDSLVKIRVTLPSGTLNLNALPWSHVLIDGHDIGVTPLGHVPLSIGPHHVIFRHPQLGEQTRAVVISAGNETRLVADLRQ